MARRTRSRRPAAMKRAASARFGSLTVPESRSLRTSLSDYSRKRRPARRWRSR